MRQPQSPRIDFPLTSERQPAHPHKRTQEPTDKFALAFTRNAFPGAPIRVGKKRLDEAKIQAVVVNNKISNVCPGGGGGDGGVGDAERVCEAVAKSMGLPSGGFVLPSSTGVIGWRLPCQAIIDVVVRACVGGVPLSRLICSTCTHTLQHK